MINSMALYLNLENTLISRLLFPQMMSKGKESYLKAIRSMDSRIRLVAPAKDWVMIAIANPEIIELIKKKKICILPTLFSHVLPDCFPETMELQFKLSSTILRKIFDKISWQGIIPENTVSSTIVDQARKFWDCVIFSVSHNNLRKLETGSYRLKDLDGKSIKLQIIANSSARMLYMRMFREKVSPIEVLSAMRNGDELKTSLFDFERPWSNIVYFPDARKSPARLDIWDTFHNFIKSETISEWDFEKSKKRRSLFLDHSDIRMWINKESEWLFEIQKNTTLKCAGRGDYFEIASLVATSSMPPRVLTRFMQNDSFPSSYNGKNGLVDLTGDVSKVKELLFICKNISLGRRVDYGAEFLPAGERLYLELLHKTILWIENEV